MHDGLDAEKDWNPSEDPSAREAFKQVQGPELTFYRNGCAVLDYLGNLGFTGRDLNMVHVILFTNSGNIISAVRDAKLSYSLLMVKPGFFLKGIWLILTIVYN